MSLNLAFPSYLHDLLETWNCLCIIADNMITPDIEFINAFVLGVGGGGCLEMGPEE